MQLSFHFMNDDMNVNNNLFDTLPYTYNSMLYIIMSI